MADSKITALTALTAADPANDMIPIVDVSDTPPASGNTKRISINNLLACSPSATLASATITGDLTVRTDKLAVTSTGVGAGTATPACPLEVYKNTNGQNRLFLNNPNTGTGAYNSIDFTTGTTSNQILSMGSGYSGSFPYLTGALVIRSGQANGMVLSTGGSAAAIQFGINDTLAMTLNSTGLGVGIVPSAGDGSGVFKAAGTGVGTANTRMGLDTRETTSGNAAGIWIGAMNSENTGVIGSRTASGNIAFQTFNGSAWGERMRIDYLGNLILQSPTTPATLTVNGQLTVNATSNTNLRFSYRGSDGTTRVANITLA